MPDLVLFNTLGRKLAPFEPLEPGVAKLYTCGPTVYNDVHIGNLRTFLFEDLLRRSLQYLGYRVVQAMNLTDVDDKTILGAHKAGQSLDEYTAPFIESFLRDLDSLHVERAEHFPRATRHIPEMIELIGRLIERGFAYESDGSVFYSIARSDLRSTLPTGVSGTSETIRTSRGYLYAPTRSFANATSSSEVASPRSDTNATTSSPCRASGRPTTPTSETAGCSSRTSSTSRGKTLKPPRMIRSFFRSTMVR